VVQKDRRSNLASHDRQRSEVEVQPERHSAGEMRNPWRREIVDGQRAKVKSDLVRLWGTVPLGSETSRPKRLRASDQPTIHRSGHGCYFRVFG